MAMPQLIANVILMNLPPRHECSAAAEDDDKNDEFYYNFTGLPNERNV